MNRRALLPALRLLAVALAGLGVFAASPALAAPAAVTAEEVLLIRPELLPVPAASPPLLRDPFNWSREQIGRFRDREPKVKTNSAAGLTLTAIIWEPGRALAVINDRITAVGDRINEATILEIMKEMVVFELAGAYHTLWVLPGSSPPRTPKQGKTSP